MALFLTTLLFTVPLFIGAALLINVCRRRAGRINHATTGRTGMCQGGQAGCGCTAALQQQIKQLPR